MNCITIVAPTYEDAVKEARGKYGDRIRIHSRKDDKRKSLAFSMILLHEMYVLRAKISDFVGTRVPYR